MRTPKFTLLLSITAFLALTSCSSDDDEPEAEPEQFVRFEATGTVSGNFSGSGTVERIDENGDHSLVFNFTDGSAFQLEFIAGPTSPPPTPSVGDYSLGGPGGDADYTVVFSDLAQGTVFLGFTEGIITFPEVGATYTTGTFEFTTSALTNPDNSIEITGGQFRVFTPE
ncbi:MAG: hypothetical protein ABR572_10780 [Cryomorphaceae bacterium]